MPYKSLVLTPTQFSTSFQAKTSQFYKGFSTVDPASKDVKLYDENLVKQDILNQFSVRRGERVMMPDFGSIIWEKLFEPLDDVSREQITSDVTRIVTADSRVTCNQITVIEKDYGIQLEITLQFIDSNQTDTLTVNFNKEIGLLSS